MQTGRERERKGGRMVERNQVDKTVILGQGQRDRNMYIYRFTDRQAGRSTCRQADMVGK